MGCGTGAFISKFQDSPYKLYGIDISPRCIEYARKKYPDISFSVGDIEATGYEDGAFDVILLSGVMHHFPCLDKLIKECHRVLKKGGVLLGYDLHCGNPFMWLYRCKKSPFYSSKGVTENERPISKKEVYDALKSCEYPVINVYCISGVTYKYFDHQLSSLILPVYNLIERTIDLPFLRQNIGSFIITYAKK
jgi:SAM-dependent methyltransferase